MKWTLVFFLFTLTFKAFAFDPRLIQIRGEVEKTAIRYFIDHAHPESGLVRDKAKNFSATPESNYVSSLAATGFGLTVIAHAGASGKIPLKFARDYVYKTLKFTRDYVPHHKGWMVHFADWKTGDRAWKCEFSTIDTALFIAGALYAAEVLKDSSITEVAEEIYERVDFSSALTDEGTKPGKKTLSLSWTPEKGWTSYQWEIYAEQKIMLILGLGHPTKPLPRETWFAWKRQLMGISMPLFIHQYSPSFFDFRNFDDGFENYFQAGLKATFLHRNMNRSGFWGYSAGESPKGYSVYSPINFSTTLCIGCAAGSAMFAPEIVMMDVFNWKNGEHGRKLWGRYGLVDSIDLKQNWFSPYVLGITKGPEYMSVQNMEGRTSIWKDFMKIKSVRKAISIIKN
ncbi:MAG: glucoamylase family protein [Bdellovibrionota bacterium]